VKKEAIYRYFRFKPESYNKNSAVRARGALRRSLGRGGARGISGAGGSGLSPLCNKHQPKKNYWFLLLLQSGSKPPPSAPGIPRVLPCPGERRDAPRARTALFLL
jgi:hypothetical protein